MSTPLHKRPAVVRAFLALLMALAGGLGFEFGHDVVPDCPKAPASAAPPAGAQ